MLATGGDRGDPAVEEHMTHQLEKTRTSPKTERSAAESRPRKISDRQPFIRSEMYRHARADAEAARRWTDEDRRDLWDNVPV